MKLNANDISRKFHIHLGLFLLFFIWLFSFTGLLLNHGNWKFASFWDEREETKIAFSLPSAILKNPEPAAILKFLKITGELQLQPKSDELLRLRVHSPGTVQDLEINLTTGDGSGKVIRFNKWGKLRTLHSFNGMSKDDFDLSPNWWITNAWRLAMDAIAIGLIIICVSSWVMWYKVRKEYKFGLILLLCSFFLTGYFLFWN